MESISNRLCLLLFPAHSNYVSSVSISILVALSLLQLILVSHLVGRVDPFPSAASKQPEYHIGNQNNRGERSSTAIDSFIERIDVDSYLKNHKALKLQFECIVNEGPCDILGKWLKPRVRTALLGECYNCSEKQRNQITKIVDYIQTTYPEEFKLGVKKYLLSAGFAVPEENTTKSNFTSFEDAVGPIQSQRNVTNITL